MPSLNSHIKTARRSDSEYNISLAKRRTWYTDPPAGDPPAGDPPPAKPPAPDPKPEPKFTQAELDAIAGNTRKEATSAATKALLKQFGVDPDDPKAVEGVKALIAAGKSAEDAKKSAETLALEKVAAAEKKAADAEAARDAVIQERQLEKRDNEIITAFTAKELGCQNPAKVMKLLKADHPQELAALLKDDGTVDATKLKALVDLGKKENPEYFDARRSTITTGSHGGGERYAGDVSKEEAYKKLDRQARRNS